MSKDLESYQILQQKVSALRSMTSIAKVTAYLHDNATPFLVRKMDKSRGDEARMWTGAHNLVTSFVDGVKEGEAGLSDLKTLAKDLEAFERAYVEATERKQEAKKKTEAKVAETEENASTRPEDTLKESDYEKLGIESQDKISKTFDKYEKWRSTLDKTTKNLFTGVRMPIVVITRGIPNPLSLKKSGLCDDLVFGYPIIKNQMLVGVSGTLQQQYQAGLKKYKAQIKNNVPVDADLSTDWEALSDALSAELKARTGKRFSMMGKAHKHGSLIWLWMIDENDLNRLSRTTSSSRFVAIDWAPPLENEFRAMTRSTQKTVRL